MSERREAKARRVADKERMTKELEELSISLDIHIRRYNELAFDLGEDVILAFKMTPEEYAQAIEEGMIDANSDKE